jgi:hypothetical protein
MSGLSGSVFSWGVRGVKKEYANAFEKGLVSTRDCRAEADALAGGTLLN